jgi:uncharacterized protein (DUF2141 family)
LALTVTAAVAVIAPLVAMAQTSAVPAAPPGQIVATVVGLRNDRGFLDVSLYGQRDWLQDRGRLGQCKVRISGRSATCAIAAPRPGTYGLAFAHDENNNGHVDQGFLGIPLEGYGFSNDVRPVLSAPSFDAARFVYRGGTVSLRMTAQY